MGYPLYSPEDASRRLVNTVCTYDGKPVYVNSIIGLPYTFSCFEITTKKKLSLDYTDPLFNYSIFKLGYCNLSGGAQFLSRDPVRHQIQGLSTRSVRNTIGQKITTGQIIEPAFAEMLNGKYPSIEYCMSHVLAENQGLAFHRNFSIGVLGRTLLCLNYRGELLGTYQQGNNSFKLDRRKDSKFIKRVLTRFNLNFFED